MEEINGIDTGSVISFLIAMLVYITGMYFHTKIITLSRKEKSAITWKLDITNSFQMSFLHTFAFLMTGVTSLVPELHTYTGSWLCYAFIFVCQYGNIYCVEHSIILCIMKYTFIVHWQRVMAFGEDKVKEIFFWLDFLLPLLNMALHILLQPYFFIVNATFAPANKCLGEIYLDRLEKNETVSGVHNLCRTMNFVEFSDYNWFNDAIFFGQKIICVIQTTLIYLFLMNIFEIFFYYKIFSFGQR